jgi:cation:H+ antiporter
LALDALLLAIAIALLLGGGDMLVRGASSLARSLGVSPLVIGLSIVAFGTSAPELAVNVLAALDGRGEISFGNIIGSNLANIGLVLAVAALLRPIAIKAPLIWREIPMMLLATAVAVVLALDGPLDSIGADRYGRSDGILLLLLFVVFLWYTVADVLAGRGRDEFIEEAGAYAASEKTRSVPLASGLTLLGLVGLTAGGRLAVDSAASLARDIGVSEAVIAMTLIAVGTSLPELVTSIVAALRAEMDLAVGNVVGSNIFNLLFVLGITASIRPVPLPRGAYADLAVVSILSVLLFGAAILNRRRIVRSEAALLLVVYVVYLGWRAAS